MPHMHLGHVHMALPEHDPGPTLIRKQRFEACDHAILLFGCPRHESTTRRAHILVGKWYFYR